MKITATDPKVVLHRKELPLYSHNQIIVVSQNSYMPYMELLTHLIEEKVSKCSNSELETFIILAQKHGVNIEMEQDDFHDIN
jgi:hypothetical protein